MVSLFLCINTCEWFSCLPLICALGPATAPRDSIVFLIFPFAVYFGPYCLYFVLFSFSHSLSLAGSLRLVILSLFYLSMRVMKFAMQNARRVFVFVCLIKTKLFFFFWFTYNLESLTKYPMNHGQKH